MRSGSGLQRRGVRRGPAAARIVEIAAALTASALMTLMVAVGGIVTQPLAHAAPASAEAAPHEPAPLAPGEES